MRIVTASWGRTHALMMIVHGDDNVTTGDLPVSDMDI